MLPKLMIRFFSDIDNTLIYSHRHHIPQPRICVEELHGKPQSYMSQKSYEYFKNQKWLSVTPVTTRTFEQYQRLHSVAQKLKWHFALICNGAVLLNDGKEVAFREKRIVDAFYGFSPIKIPLMKIVRYKNMRYRFSFIKALMPVSPINLQVSLHLQ